MMASNMNQDSTAGPPLTMSKNDALSVKVTSITVVPGPDEAALQVAEVPVATLILAKQAPYPFLRLASRFLEANLTAAEKPLPTPRCGMSSRSLKLAPSEKAKHSSFVCGTGRQCRTT